MNDALGDRMKERYEDRSRIMLPRRSYTIIRVDGKAFHTLTRGCARPFDPNFGDCMDAVAIALTEEAQGARLGYVQSDEVSVLLTDFETTQTDAWFGGNLQKICSVAASCATAAFNQRAHRLELGHLGWAMFDARVFQIPDPVEVENYFIWRQKDAERNSLSMLCQSYFSHRELHGKDREAQHELLHTKGVNWNDLPTYWKRGRCAVSSDAGWVLDDRAPVFTQERPYLTRRVPRQWSDPLNWLAPSERA